MRYYLLLIFTLIQYASFGQSYLKGIVTNRVTVNYPDHAVLAQVSAAKPNFAASPEKNYFWYGSNQIKSTQGGYSGKLLDGLYTDFYPNKNLKEKGEFVYGLKSGKWNSWAENAVLKETVNWKAGNKTGKFLVYDANGKLKESGRYKKGLIDGKKTVYSGKDSTTVTYYKHGNPVPKPVLKWKPAFLKKVFKKKDPKSTQPNKV